MRPAASGERQFARSLSRPNPSAPATPAALTKTLTCGQTVLTRNSYHASKIMVQGGYMKGLRKILIPTDLSENSRRALVYGCRLACGDKSSLLILRVANGLSDW